MQTGKPKKAAPNAGRSARGGRARRHAVCDAQPAAAEQAAPAIVASSLATLTVTKKPAIEVFFTQGGTLQGKPADGLIEDLTASYQAAEEYWNDLYEMDLVPECSTPAKHLAELVKVFACRFATDDLDCVIDTIRNDDGTERHCFTLVRHCPDSDSWKIIEVKKLWAAAKSHSIALEKILWSFLKLFIEKVHLGTWYNGGMDYAIDWLEERVDSDWEYDPPEEGEGTRSLADDLYCYRYGEALNAQNLIDGAATLTPEQIIKKLETLRPCSLINSIRDACEFLHQPYNIDFFDNGRILVCDDDDYGGIEALSYWQQHTVLWDYEDGLTEVWKEWLDMERNEGGRLPPTATFRVDPEREDWDRTLLDNCGEWPFKLEEVFRNLDAASEDQSTLINILV